MGKAKLEDVERTSLEEIEADRLTNKILERRVCI